MEISESHLKMKVPVNVSIPAFNSSKYIIDALNSIINQNVEVECINVCDDFSEDDTCSIVEEWKKNHPGIKLNLIRNAKNLGYGGNLDVCLDNCTSEFLQLLHADDLLKENAISNSYEAFLKNKELALVGGKEEFVNQNLKLKTPAKEAPDLLFKEGQVYEFAAQTAHYIPVSSVMLNTQKAKETGKFNLNNLSYDEFLWLRIVQKHPILIQGTEKISRRIHGENLMFKWFFQKKNEFVKAIKFFISEVPKLEKRDDKRQLLIKYQKKRYGKLLVGCAGSVLRHFKSSKTAFFYLKEAFKLSPAKTVLNKSFWKVLILSFLNTLGLYNILYSRKLDKTRLNKVTNK